MLVTGKMKLFFQVPGAFQYLKMGPPISALLNACKPGRTGGYMGTKKKIAATEGGGGMSQFSWFSLLIPFMTL